MVSDPRIREEIMRKQELEMEMRSDKQAALVRLAKINMDQAIQIATSQQPGKVMVCTLDAKGWEEPGKLGERWSGFLPRHHRGRSERRRDARLRQRDRWHDYEDRERAAAKDAEP